MPATCQHLLFTDSLIIANGLNSISDGALDNALNQAFGSKAAGTYAGKAANDGLFRSAA